MCCPDEFNISEHYPGFVSLHYPGFLMYHSNIMTSNPG